MLGAGPPPLRASGLYPTAAADLGKVRFPGGRILRGPRNGEEPLDRAPILTWNDRGGMRETQHRGHVVLLDDAGGRRVLGDPEYLTFPRSSLKPLQLLPLFSDPRFATLGLTREERAVLVASHSGDERHVRAVRVVLAKAGIPEEALGCGVHPPIDSEAMKRLYAGGGEAGRIHHNCSGKHSGFLLRAKMLGAPLKGYLDPDHPVQREVREVLAKLGGVPPADLEPAIDGCGAPTYRLPLSAMARAFRDLANPELLPAPWREGARMIFEAVNAAPHFLAGRGRFDTALLSARPFRFLCKGGADGFLALGVRAGNHGGGDWPPLGIAVKIEDGATRGYETLVPRLLARLGLLNGREEELRRFAGGKIENSQKLEVGERHTVADSEEELGWQPLETGSQGFRSVPETPTRGASEQVS